MSAEEPKNAKLIAYIFWESIPYVFLISSKLGLVMLPTLCATWLMAISLYGFIGGLACIAQHGIEEIELRCRERKYEWISYIGRITTFYTIISSGWIMVANCYGFVVVFGFVIRAIGLIKVRKIEQEIINSEGRLLE